MSVVETEAEMDSCSKQPCKARLGEDGSRLDALSLNGHYRVLRYMHCGIRSRVHVGAGCFSHHFAGVFQRR